MMIEEINKEEFIRRISKNSKEDVGLIKVIEDFFLKKRKYVFKTPKSGDSVILMVSGGLDSTIVWGILLYIYKYKVYPVYINRDLKKSKKEFKAVRYFDSFFRKRFPTLSQKVFVLSARLPPPEIDSELAQKSPTLYYSNESILDNIDININNLPLTTELSFIYPVYGMVYANYLKNRFNFNIKNIFSAVLPTDGTVVASQSFTSLRSTLLMMCTSTGCYDWNFASFTFEKEIGHFISKSQLVAIGKKLKLPLYKTWSCYYSGLFQCGDNCVACLSRMDAFKTNKLIDKTVYKKDVNYYIDKLKIKF